MYEQKLYLVVHVYNQKCTFKPRANFVYINATVPCLINCSAAALHCAIISIWKLIILYNVPYIHRYIHESKSNFEILSVHDFFYNFLCFFVLFFVVARKKEKLYETRCPFMNAFQGENYVENYYRFFHVITQNLTISSFMSADFEGV